MENHCSQPHLDCHPVPVSLSYLTAHKPLCHEEALGGLPAVSQLEEKIEESRTFLFCSKFNIT